MKFRWLAVFLFVFQSSLFVLGQSTNVLHMFLPEHKGALELNLAGFQIERSGLRPDGKQFVVSAKRSDGLFLTAFVELAPHPGGNAQVREDWWGALKKNSRFKMDDQRFSDLSDSALSEYVIHEAKGMPVEQKNVHAYYGGDEIWAEVHISKVKFQSEDRRLFTDALAGVKMLSSYTPDSKDEFAIGSILYDSQKYQQAAVHYQKALDLEKEKPAFNRMLTRVLIDQLGMSYGISNQLEKSRAVFEYGISIDPDYPLFYYNVACGYGEKNDKNNALEFLKKAFERKANVIKSEKMPDPLTDDSFRNFVSDVSFVKAVKAMQ